jgi:hypothetical protein
MTEGIKSIKIKRNGINMNGSIVNYRNSRCRRTILSKMTNSDILENTVSATVKSTNTYSADDT